MKGNGLRRTTVLSAFSEVVRPGCKESEARVTLLLFTGRIQFRWGYGERAERMLQVHENWKDLDSKRSGHQKTQGEETILPFTNGYLCVQVYYSKFPPSIEKRKILLLHPTLGGFSTGNFASMIFYTKSWPYILIVVTGSQFFNCITSLPNLEIPV